MEEVWLQAQSNMEKVLTQQTFSTWIKPIQYLTNKKHLIILEVPNRFFREWVVDNYLSMIQESIRSLSDAKMQVEFQVSVKDQEPAALVAQPAADQVPPPAEPDPTAAFPSNLNAKYTFETFVCGGSNQFAHAAAQAVANNPAGKYNPLFIYGGVGLGKTHLLTAIGNQVLARNQKARVCFYTSE